MLDDDDSEITAGSTVTLTIHLKRTDISVSLDNSVTADTSRIIEEDLDDTPDATEDATVSVCVDMTVGNGCRLCMREYGRSSHC